MISDWSTYNLSDFILFSRDALLRVELNYNAAIWPYQILAILLACVVFFLFRQGGEKNSKIVFGILSFFWAWIGVAYHHVHFQSINWVAKYFSWLFLLQAALLFVWGTVLGKLTYREKVRTWELVIFGLMFFSPLVIFPATLFRGESWQTVLLFGWGPDETAHLTLLLLFFTRQKRAIVVAVLPILWCILSMLISLGIRT